MFTNATRAATRAVIAGSLMLTGLVAAPVALADDHDDDDDRFGAYIYAGTVDNLDEATVVEEIDDLELEGHDRDDSDDHDDDRDRDRDRDRYWQVLGDGQDLPDELYTGDEDLDDSIDLDTLTSEPHMVVIHETESQDSPVIAVGVIEGDVTDDGTLLIQLDEFVGSGWEGRAWFGPEFDDDDDDDDSDDLEVVVGVYPAGSVEPLGSPAPIG